MGTRRVTDARMLDAARDVFATDGFDAADMERVAERAGTTKPTLYAHFRSKEGLFRAALSRELELLVARLTSAYDNVPRELEYEARLAIYVRAFFDLAAERPEGFRLIFTAEHHRVAAELHAQTHDGLKERIAELLAADNDRELGPACRLVAAMILETIMGCARDAIARGVNLERASDLAVSFLHTTLAALDRDVLDAVDRS